MSENIQSSESSVELPITAQRHLEREHTEQEKPSYASYTQNINNGNPTFEAISEPEEKDIPEWWFAEGIKGEGDKPEYFNDKTFKTLADQAKAHQDLLKMKSRPKESSPETYEYELDESYDIDQYGENLLTSFADVCKQNNISQDQFTSLIDGYLENVNVISEQQEKDDYQKLLKEKELLGPDADDRLRGMKQWADSTMPPEMVEILTNNMRNSDMFKFGEYLMQNMGYHQMPVNSESASSNINERHLQARQKMKDHKYGRDTAYTKMVDDEYRKLAEIGAFKK